MSQAQLFTDLPEVLSPKIRWMRANGVEVFANAKEWVGLEVAETGEIVAAWSCGGMNPQGKHYLGGGDTAEDAILDWCEKSGVPHWSVSEMVSEREQSK